MPIALDNSAPLNLDDPADNSPPWSAADLAAFTSEIQGNILRPHGRDHVEIRFIQRLPGTTADDVRTIIRTLAGFVTFQAQQRQQAARFKQALATQASFATRKSLLRREEFLRPEIPQVPFVSLWLTHHTLKLLRLNWLNCSWLKDPAFWDPTEQEDGTGAYAKQDETSQVLMVLLIAHDQACGCSDHWKKVIKPALLNCRGWQVQENYTETGAVLRARRGGRIEKVEHFGYVDGISEPRIVAKTPPLTQWNADIPLGQVLFPDAPGQSPHACGSYFSLLKLEQNPQSFHASATTPQFYSHTVGRARDGMPVEPAAVAPNDFAYTDPAQGGCPYHAHIRRANPRGTSPKPPEEKRVLFLRRSIPYGTRALDPDGLLDEQAPLPAGGVGLLFMACMSRPTDQINQTLKHWLRADDFPSALNKQPGGDPLIHGVGPDGKPFVTQRGRLNCYAPSRSALLALGTPPPPPA